MQSAIEYAAIPTINLTPLFLVTNPLTNSSQSDTLQVKSLILVQSTNLVGEILYLNKYAQNYYTDVVTCG